MLLLSGLTLLMLPSFSSFLGCATIIVGLSKAMLRLLPHLLSFYALQLAHLSLVKPSAPAFAKLKSVLASAPVLCLFDPSLPSRVLADTSGLATGAVLE